MRRLECIAWDAETGLRCAELLAKLCRTDQAMPVKNSLIEATALAHGLTMATRNRSDFEKADLKIEGPFGG